MNSIWQSAHATCRKTFGAIQQTILVLIPAVSWVSRVGKLLPKICRNPHAQFATCMISVLGINRATNLVTRLHHGASIQTYQISGKFGKATESNFKDSLLTNRATYHHIFSGKLTSLVASMQASHQRQMFEMSGVDIQSQAAYELACKGPIRPSNRQNPTIYGIRCIEFNRPEFTLEIQAMNASEEYLCNIIAEIGLQLRSVAHCTKIRCTRYGFFTYQDSLLRAKWRPQHLLQNMVLCQEIISANPSMLSDESTTPIGHESRTD